MINLFTIYFQSKLGMMCHCQAEYQPCKHLPSQVHKRGSFNLQMNQGYLSHHQFSKTSKGLANLLILQVKTEMHHPISKREGQSKSSPCFVDVFGDALWNAYYVNDFEGIFCIWVSHVILRAFWFAKYHLIFSYAFRCALHFSL